MTDNGSGYVSRLFRKACRLLHLRHIRTRPYTPKTNGKAERFIQTAPARMGLRPAVPQLGQPRRRPAPMAAPLQSGAAPC